MEPETWPPGIRQFIDERGARANGTLIVEVEYSEPVWTVSLGCTCCGIVRLWNLVGEKPAGPTPLPAWLELLEMT